MPSNSAPGPLRRPTGSGGPPGGASPWLWAVSSGGLLIAASWLVLWSRIWAPGLETGFKDARHYLASAFRLASMGRLELLELHLRPLGLESQPLSSFPPLTSWAIAGLVALGSSIERAPTLLSLAAWPLLLGGMAFLTFRLSRDAALAQLALGIAALTWPFLNVYTEVSSEILFLPLVVLATVAFTGLPEREGRITGSLVLGTLLTTLVLLARYTGMFFYAALLGWWIWHRVRRGRVSRLARELLILGVPGVLFLAWLVRNLVLTGHLFGPVLMSETLDVGYDHVVRTFLVQGSWLALPAVRPGPVWHSLGVGGVLLAAAPVLLGAGALFVSGRCAAPRLPSSPIGSFLGLYVGFLAAAPAFMRMQGMTERYMAVVLALAQPYLVARLTAVPRRWARAILLGFLAVNLGLALFFTASHRGLGFWLETQPIRAADLGGDPEEQMRHLLAGAPAWWVHRPPRLHDLERHLPGLARIVGTLDARTPIVSNAPELFSWRPILPAGDAVELWLQRGECRPPVVVAVVIVDWDRWQDEPTAASAAALPVTSLSALLEHTCPDAERTEVAGGMVYLLRPSAPEGTPGARVAAAPEGQS